MLKKSTLEPAMVESCTIAHFKAQADPKMNNILLGDFNKKPMNYIQK